MKNSSLGAFQGSRLGGGEQKERWEGVKRWKGSGSSCWWSGFRLKRCQRPVLETQLTGLGCDRVSPQLWVEATPI